MEIKRELWLEKQYPEKLLWRFASLPLENNVEEAN